MQVALPISPHAPGARCGLIEGMVLGWGERRTIVELIGRVVPAPVLAWLEATDQLMARIGGVVACMLGGRGVTATDVPALREALTLASKLP
jgi:hypothetical protein